jgi:hypothetical protein
MWAGRGQQWHPCLLLYSYLLETSFNTGTLPVLVKTSPLLPSNKWLQGDHSSGHMVWRVLLGEDMCACTWCWHMNTPLSLFSTAAMSCAR